jgi:hypothetical protein
MIEPVKGVRRKSCGAKEAYTGTSKASPASLAGYVGTLALKAAPHTSSETDARGGHERRYTDRLETWIIV